MFCSECGRQIPDGSRYCNFCGAEIAVNDMNPDTEPVPEQYQDYSTNVNPKGFEALPYNRHGYDQQTTNNQHGAIPNAGFTTQSAYPKEKYPSGQSPAGGDSRPPRGGSVVYSPQQPWQKDFAVRNPRMRGRRWMMPLLIGAAAALIVLAAILLFSCGSKEESQSSAAPRQCAGLAGSADFCPDREDQYTVLADPGACHVQGRHLADGAPRQELPADLRPAVNGNNGTV